MTQIKVEIKTRGSGTICSWRCQFFNTYVMGDQCRIFGPLRRCTPDKLISYRHIDCSEATVKETKNGNQP